MKLQRVTIKKYKNLKDFDCIFPNSNIAAFIGNNGSGKSNLLEAITEAFSYAKKKTSDNGTKTMLIANPFLCKIQYECDNKIYILECDNSNVSISYNGQKLNKLEMQKALPETIMLYYAGETSRQTLTARATHDESYNNKLKRETNDTFSGYKYIDSYSIEDLPLLLIAAAVYKGNYYKKLMNFLNCKDILPTTGFLLRNPNRTKGTADTYWGARGFVRSFLDGMRKTVNSTDDLINMYKMLFNDITSIKGLSKNENELFAKLKALDNAGYIDKVVFQLNKTNGESFFFDELSEGEKQLSLLLLLTSFTAKSNVLYLFDEFDAYLHLNWQKVFSKLLNEVNVNGHIIFTTHSPATISGMQKQNVFIMADGKVSPARSETYNRSLDEIMEEHMRVSMRPKEYIDLEQEFRNAVMDGRKDLAEEALIKIGKIVGETDPFFITARIVLSRME